MGWLDGFNSAISYIEENLGGEISFDRAARLACCSTYHFQRMFSYIAGVSLSEYIRRRRLTLAAFALRKGGRKVIDVALEYGYDSPEAFSRAFKSLHGVSPSEARAAAALKAYPRITFLLTVRGDTEMNYRIQQREAFEVFGTYAEISTDREVAFEQVPSFFRKCDEDGVPDAINALLGRFHDSHTVSALYDFSEDSFKYMLCNFLPPGLEVPERFTRLAVPAATWAVFDAPGAEVQDTWRRVWGEWFPSSGCEAADGPQFEMYYGLAAHENIHAEIWVPVREKRV
jgi:AraC family transcriptional regulator